MLCAARSKVRRRLMANFWSDILEEMLSDPLVSIITPALNRGRHIEGCIRSVMGQSYRNIEHIVVDGGSTDNTIDVVRAYAGKYNLKWISEPDGGMYDAIDKGFRLASGDVLAYLNTDDLYFPWSVETAVSALRSGCDIVFGDGCVVTDSPARQSAEAAFFPAFDYAYYRYVGTIMQPTVFYTRAVREHVGQFDPRFRLLADCNYWLRCAEAGFVPSKIDEMIAVQIDHGETLRETHQKRVSEEFALLRGQADGRSHLRWQSKIRRFVKTRLLGLKFGLSFRAEGRYGWTRFIQSRPRSTDISALLKAGLPGAFRPENGAVLCDAKELLALCRDGSK